jgi:hypothetical protein
MTDMKLPIEVTKSLIGIYGQEYIKRIPDIFTYNILDKWTNIKNCLLLVNTPIKLTCHHKECVEFISYFPYMFPCISLSDENIQRIDDIYIYIKIYLMFHNNLLVIDSKTIESIITHSMEIYDVEFICLFSDEILSILMIS